MTDEKEESTNIIMDLGGTIKQCRSVKKLTLAQLSKDCGISISHLSLLENNNREPSFSAVKAIAQALGLPLSVLIFLATQKDEVTELSAVYVEALSKNIMDLNDEIKNKKLLQKLPVFLRTINDKKLDNEKLNDLIDLIRKS